MPGRSASLRAFAERCFAVNGIERSIVGNRRQFGAHSCRNSMCKTQLSVRSPTTQLHIDSRATNVRNFTRSRASPWAVTKERIARSEQLAHFACGVARRRLEGSRAAPSRRT
jgi:hypothetical protein